MAIIASVVDGVLKYDYTDSSATTSKAGQSTLDYDQFLQLLCAEMQYQDPLEPTSNTDYVAQLATFSQLEATLSQTDSIEKQTESIQESTIAAQLNFANSLVGKDVIIANDDGSYVTGTVDYVMYEDGQVLLAVGDNLYPLENLDTVANSEYYDAVTLANTFSEMLSVLPAYADLDTSYNTMVTQLVDMYEGMSDYEKSFIDSTTVNTLYTYRDYMAELVAAEEEAAAEEQETTETE